VALIFDEVQGLSDELLEELRLLRNVRSAGERRLQIILVGHLDFVRRLGQPHLAQLNQRIGARAILPVLRRGEIHDYLDHRLRAHGGSLHKLFTRRALRELDRHCGRIPRKINLLCDNALLGAYAQGVYKVSFKQMKAAVRDYDNLLWGARDRNWWSRVRGPGGTGRGHGLGLVRLAGVCGLVLIALALCYRLNFVAQAALRLAAHQRVAAILVSRVNPVPEQVTALVQTTHEQAKPAAAISQASNQSAAATTASAPPQSKSPVSSTEPTAQKEPTSAAQASAPAPQAELSPQPPPAPATEATPAVAAAADPVASAEHPVVVVKKGDSLSKIASHYFGSGGPDQVHNLIQANPQITDADRIYPGQVIYVRESRSGNQATGNHE
jgi:general secretion pathway protein A